MVKRVLLACALLVVGCADSTEREPGDETGVGESCRPEAVPARGFEAEDVYVETSSVQCESRSCLVYFFEGDPTTSVEEDPSCTDCPTTEEIEQRVYCSCRCALPDGTRNDFTCECPDGFFCEDLDRGWYCVKPITMR